MLEMLKKTIRPEFLNRIDETIMFLPLTQDQIRQVVRLQISGITKMLQGNGITLQLTDAAVDFLARTGFDPEFGARPVKRAIQRYLLNDLSKTMLAQNIDRTKPILPAQRLVEDHAGAEHRPHETYRGGRGQRRIDVPQLKAEKLNEKKRAYQIAIYLMRPLFFCEVCKFFIQFRNKFTLSLLFLHVRTAFLLANSLVFLVPACRCFRFCHGKPTCFQHGIQICFHKILPVA